MGSRTFALFTCAFLLALLVNTPASLLDKILQSASQGRVVLANTSGTIWKGSATPALRTQAKQYIALQPLHWNIDLLSPLSGSIKIRLQWNDQPAASAMDATFFPGGIELRHVRLPLPAQALSEISPMLNTAQFRGQLQIQSDQVTFSSHGMKGTAVIDWQQASSALSSIDPLGNYRLVLNGAGDRIHIVLTTSSGMLLLEGQGAWLSGQGLEFHGKAQASSENHDNLAELLHHLGPEVSPGVHGFSLAQK